MPAGGVTERAARVKRSRGMRSDKDERAPSKPEAVPCAHGWQHPKVQGLATTAGMSAGATPS